MSADAAIDALPLAPSPVALHTDKVRGMVTDTRANHPGRRAHESLPWAEIAAGLSYHPCSHGGYTCPGATTSNWLCGANAAVSSWRCADGDSAVWLLCGGCVVNLACLSLARERKFTSG